MDLNISTGQAVVATVVNNEREVIALAHAVRHEADIRFLPAVE
ncbi:MULTISPECIES: hypothetical protein [unclassified Caballeronia]|nr:MULTISPECIES: hypothetical protein [unclassified Caballeronia]